MPVADMSLSTRTVRAIVWIAAGLCLALAAYFPVTVRHAQRLQAGVDQLHAKNASLANALRESLREAHGLRGELRELRDSVLVSLRSNPAGVPLSRRHARALRFDSRLPWTLDNGSRSHRVVALTFDGDAHTNAIKEILDTLASRKVRATMFITGNFVRHNPRAVKAIFRAGHEIGNHTYSHPHLTSWESTRTQTTLQKVNRAFLVNELGRTDAAFRSLTGHSMAPLWRAPYGEKNRQLCRWAQDAGYLHVGWRQGRTWRENLDSNDWAPDPDHPAYHSPREVLQKITNAARAKPSGIHGGIILMHLGVLRKERSQRVHLSLGTMIDTLRSMGYSFVTVGEMARLSGIDLTLLGDRAQIAANGR